MAIKPIYYVLVLFTCLLTAGVTNSQILTDVMAEPKPYLRPPYFEDVVKDPIKAVAFITRIDVDRGLHSDTTYLYAYNKDKRQEKLVRYEKNRPANIYHFKYTGANKTYTWEEESIQNAGSRLIVYDEYDKSGNKIIQRGFNVLKKDTVSRNIHRFIYDRDNHPLEKTITINNQLTLQEEYFYNGGKLVKHNSRYNPATQKSYMQVLYAYNNEGLLVDKKEYQVLDSGKTQLNYHFYSYEKKKLVKEKYTTTSGKSETVVLYSYDESNRLKEMNITKDTLYKKVQYEYDKDKVRRINVTTNAWNWLNGEFYIPLPSLNSLTKMPAHYEEQYSYDSRGNLVEKKLLLNGQIAKIIDFKIEYY
jgi:hypothetical protein